MENVKISVLLGALAYFEEHKELFDDPSYYCAYRVALNEYIGLKYRSFPINFAVRLCEDNVVYFCKNTPSEEIDKFKTDVSYLVSLVQRYDLINNYSDAVKEYVGEMRNK